jgi:C-terminal processing protease CtpA/Prc
MKCLRTLILSTLTLMGSSLPVLVHADARVDASTRKAVIEQVTAAMNERYVFPEVAQQVAAALKDPARLAALQLDDATAFAKAMTDLLQGLTKDKHLRVMHSASPVPESRGDRPAAADIERAKADARRTNFGVERVERLPGNIGYLELRSFTSAEWAGPALAAAMTLLGHSDALIIDLRRNGGGDPATVALLSSYLLDERTHLNSLYFRPSNTTSQFWSQDWVPGTRFGGSKPVYVLTSRRTFSGAEEFSYNLKALKRGLTVGETTGGGAHPGELRKVGEHFRMFVATGRAINPITKTNWEGTGVSPDIASNADDALRVAQVHALQGLQQKADADPVLRRQLQTRIAELEKAGS